MLKKAGYIDRVVNLQYDPMKLYEATEKDKDILTVNIFSLLELDGASVEEKEKYLLMITELIYQYFLGEKVEDALTKEQLEELMKKYPPENEENVENMLEEISDISPNAPQLMVDAIVEVKARIVMDQYTTKLQGYTDLAKKEKDPEKKKYFEDKVADYSRRLDLVQNGDWAILAAL